MNMTIETKGMKCWTIPNSRMIFSLEDNSDIKASIYMKRLYDNNIYTSSMFNAYGKDAFSATEKMMQEVNMIADTWWNILQSCKENSEIIERNDYWNFPIDDNDFDKGAFTAVRTIFQSNSKDKDIVRNIYYHYHSNDSKISSKYFGALLLNDKVIFKSKCDFEKNISFKYMMRYLTSVGGMLDKIQTGVWNALINTDEPEFYINKKGYNHG